MTGRSVALVVASAAAIGALVALATWIDPAPLAALLGTLGLVTVAYGLACGRAAARTRREMVDLLERLPELAGRSRAGHAAAVAELGGGMAADLHFTRAARRQLRTAARLHHLGEVCVDEPTAPGRPSDPLLVDAVGAGLLETVPWLAPSAEHLRPPSGSDDGRHRGDALGAEVLRVASAFDELTGGDPAWSDGAYAALASAPLYLYDTRVLGALRRVLRRRAPATS